MVGLESATEGSHRSVGEFDHAQIVGDHDAWSKRQREHQVPRHALGPNQRTETKTPLEISLVRRLQVDLYPVDGATEPCAPGRVAIDDRRTGVRADVEGLVKGDQVRDGWLDAPFTYLLTIGMQQIGALAAGLALSVRRWPESRAIRRVSFRRLVQVRHRES